MRRNVLAPGLAGLVSVLVVLSGCAPDGSPSESDSASSSAMDASPRDLAPYLSQVIGWGECDGEWLVDANYQSEVMADSTVDCSTVLVPATYLGSEDIPDFSIAMMRLRKKGTEPDAAIFINPGGPGGSGIDQVQSADFPGPLRDEYAFIGFDPRGVGYSDFADGSEIKCSDELDFTSYFQEGSLANEAELAEAIERSDAYYQDCVDRNPYWWTLSTDHVVQDLDILRELVTPGARLNFIGSSYGTTIAGRYVSDFPDTVGKIVFDSPTTVASDRIESEVTDLEARERKLRGWVEGYATHAGISFDQAWASMLDLRQRADDDLLIGYAGYERSSVYPQYMASSESLLINGIFALNYWPEAQAQEYFNNAIDTALSDNWIAGLEWLAFTMDGYDPDSLDGTSLANKAIVRSNEYEVRVIVTSMDYDLPELSEDEQRELSDRLKEVGPLWSELTTDPSGFEYFGPSMGLDWASIADDDDSIPDPPTTPFIPANPSGKQLLIVGSIYESVTPYSFAQDTAKLLGSPLISIESENHAPAAWYNNECLNDILVRYFLTDEVIADTTCG